MKPALALLAGLLLAGCSVPPPFKAGDTLVSLEDGTTLGKVIELGSHHFANGADGTAIHVALESGQDAWYSLDTTAASYRVKK